MTLPMTLVVWRLRSFALPLSQTILLLAHIIPSSPAISAHCREVMEFIPNLSELPDLPMTGRPSIELPYEPPRISYT